MNERGLRGQVIGCGMGLLVVAVAGSTACSEPDWVGDAPESASAATKPASADAGSGGGSDCIDEGEDGGSAGEGERLDPKTLTACCEGKGQAHCVPEAKVPASTRSSLSACPSGGLCVPDTIIEGQAPKSCDSGFGDGVCVSLCVKAVADKANLLKQATCATGEVCAPCISPLDNKPTGACDLGKAGMSKPAPKTPCSKSKNAPGDASAPSNGGSDAGAPSPSGPTTCCGGKGTCVPENLVPADQRDRLEPKECSDAKLCAPTENIDKAFKPKACTGSSLTGSYSGVCLSNCIAFDFLESLVSGQGSCDADHRCIPCKTPFGTSTGAPGCE